MQSRLLCRMIVIGQQACIFHERSNYSAVQVSAFMVCKSSEKHDRTIAFFYNAGALFMDQLEVNAFD